ncbi:patched domain-containing protein 3-like [Centruroides vittatus]|uniref:patched domain-containing protein 3-like n=1 Tax=Centruroides vittatus TaxID=120091 RepID=UPI00350F36FA
MKSLEQSPVLYFKQQAVSHLHYIYTAINGKAAQNREFTKSHFPMNTSYYVDSQRISDKTIGSAVQIVAKDEGNLLQENIINEIIVLDSMIKNITVKWNENSANYKVLKYRVKYLIILDELLYSYEEYASSVGGMIIDKNGYLINFKAVRLLYLLDISDKRKENAIKNWKIAFNELLQSKQFNHISISFINDYVVDKEIQKFTDRLLLRLPIVFIIVVAFSLVTCMTNDWVKSKPWLGPSTCISAALAIVSGLGIMRFAGVTYIDFNIALCYVILGTEIDDSFVLIAAWRISDSRKSVCRCLGETYSEAGVIYHNYIS